VLVEQARKLAALPERALTEQTTFVQVEWWRRLGPLHLMAGSKWTLFQPAHPRAPRVESGHCPSAWTTAIEGPITRTPLRRGFCLPEMNVRFGSIAAIGQNRTFVNPPIGLIGS